MFAENNVFIYWANKTGEMKLITVLLLLSVFALAACASQENAQQPDETQDEPSQAETPQENAQQPDETQDEPSQAETPQENAQQPDETQDEPSQAEGCQFLEPFNCAANYVLDDSIEMLMSQGTGREAVIRDIIVQSDAFSETSPGSGVYHNCSLNEGQKGSRFRQKSIFILDESTDGSTCTYRDTSSNQNRYAVQIRYSWADEDTVNTIDGEFSASLSESPPSLFSYLDWADEDTV